MKTCCIRHLRTMNPNSGDKTTCPLSGDEYVWDGLRWQTPSQLGPHKMDKLRRVRNANAVAQPLLGL